MKVLERSSQNPDLNPTRHLWRDLNMSQFYPTELERICRDEGQNLLKPAVTSNPTSVLLVLPA